MTHGCNPIGLSADRSSQLWLLLVWSMLCYRDRLTGSVGTAWQALTALEVRLLVPCPALHATRWRHICDLCWEASESIDSFLDA